MAEEWPGQAELHARLRALNGISSSKIASIAALAVRSAKFYKFIVHAIERHIRHGDKASKLQGFCIIDAILRRARESLGDKSPFPERFAKNLDRTLDEALECDPDDRNKVFRIVRIWESSGVFGEDGQATIRRKLADLRLKDPSMGQPPAPQNVAEPTSRLLDSIGQFTARQSAPPVVVEVQDDFDYGDDSDEDDEARKAAQLRRLEEQRKRLEASMAEERAKQEAAARAATPPAPAPPPPQPEPVPPPPPETAAPASIGIPPYPAPLGFVYDPDQTNVAAGTVRVISSTVYIGALPSGITAPEVRAQIEPYGPVDDVRVVNGGAAGENAFVRYPSREAAERARELIRQAYPTYKLGWGKGVGVNRDEFDIRTGVGFVNEQTLIQIQQQRSSSMRPPRGAPPPHRPPYRQYQPSFPPPPQRPPATSSYPPYAYPFPGGMPPPPPPSQGWMAQQRPPPPPPPPARTSALEATAAAWLDEQLGGGTTPKRLAGDATVSGRPSGKRSRFDQPSRSPTRHPDPPYPPPR
ncbi:CID domain-containing protein [Plasmodiophora brassicae]|uniref:CID domain-containing protein n=1 Tax=Plasmodiophora brassicae TaxID=37360 RepID=A0A0G4IY57_PLABS|nr:hypothetical protein PBRA_007735 [Plasmodiophora brassicae]SPQ99039.1 unnamed protein product [Plasmodiophora brassicae]